MQSFPIERFPRSSFGNVISNQDLPQFISFHSFGNPLNRKGDTFQPQIFQPKSTKVFVHAAPFPVNPMSPADSLSIKPKELSNLFLNHIKLSLGE